MRPTVVTAYYTMPSKYPKETYAFWIEQFLQCMNCNLVFFVETEEMKDKLGEYCSWPERVVFKVVKKEEWKTVQTRGITFWENQLNLNAEEADLHKSFLLGAIWTEKMYFVEKAIEENPFHSDTFFWCDAGIMRSETDACFGFMFGCDESVISRDKFHILQVAPIKNDEGKYWSPNQASEVRFGGGIFGASKETWKNIIPLYEEMFEELVKENICVFKDQIVWANVIKRYPDFFHIIEAHNDWFHLLRLWSRVPYSKTVPTFIINLDKRKDRWKEMKQVWTLDEHTFRFPALKHGQYSPFLNRKIVHGCASSHLSIISICRGKPCIVLEDDADPEPDISLQTLRESFQYLSSWDLINFGTSTISGLHHQHFGAVRFLANTKFLQTKITSTTHCMGYNGSMLNYIPLVLNILSKVFFTAEKSSNIDYIFGSGTLLPQIIQMIPAEKVYSRQRISQSDISNAVTNYNHFFDIVNAQLFWISQSWIPFSAPIIMELMGGLGNQLFMVAAGLYFAQKTGRPLAILRIPHQENPHSSINYLDTIFKQFPKITSIPESFCVRIRENQVEKSISDVDKTLCCILNGYFQKTEYVTETFVSMLHLPPANKVSSVSMHIRGGDYKTVPLHKVDLFAYRRKALLYTDTEKELTIFTDDVEYAKDILQMMNIKDYVFSTSTNEVDDLVHLAATSDVLIGCNSTFSWWACYLSNKNTLKFLPKKWFTEGEAERLFYIPGLCVI